MEELLGHDQRYAWAKKKLQASSHRFSVRFFFDRFQEWKATLCLSKFLQLRLNLFLMSKMPFWCTQAYTWVLSTIYFSCWHGQMEATRQNISKVMKDCSPDEIDKIVHDTLKGIVRHYQEKLFNAYQNRSVFREFLLSSVRFDETEGILQEALEEGRGVIIATGHYGGLEFLPVYLALKKYPTTTMVHIKTEELKKVLSAQAEKIGLRLIIPGDVPNVLREATRMLKENGILVTQCDELDAWHPDAGCTMEFLGSKIHPDRTLNVLCKKTGAVLLFGLMQREPKKGYKFILHRVTKEGSEPINVRTLKLLERYIYRHPEQWYEWKKYERFAYTR